MNMINRHYSALDRFNQSLESDPRRLASVESQPWFDAMPGEVLRIRVGSTGVGGRYSVLESVSQPDAGAPLHTHLEDEVFFVLEGALTFEVAGERSVARAGAVVVIPGGVAHAWRNFGDRPARCMMTFTPGGVDKLFAALPQTPPEQLAETAARYGTIVLGPLIGR